METLDNTYREQIEHIGDILVRAGIITREEVQRQGVRFALRDKLEPLPFPKTNPMTRRAFSPRSKVK